MSNKVDIKDLSEEQKKELFQSVYDEINKAKASDVPFLAGHETDELQVIGDANKVEEVKQSYTLGFSVPVTESSLVPEEYVNNVDEDGYIRFEKEYINPTIKAYRRLKMMKQAIDVILFYKQVVKVDDEGELIDIEPEVLMEFLFEMEEQLIITFYNFVKSFFEEDENLIAYANSFDIIVNAMMIISANQDLIKEAEHFLMSDGMQETVQKYITSGK